MTSDVVYCFENQEVDEAADLMKEQQIRRIFVVNQDGELIGVTSLGEIATVTGDRALAGETLERIPEPAESKSVQPEEQNTDVNREEEVTLISKPH